MGIDAFDPLAGARRRGLVAGEATMLLLGYEFDTHHSSELKLMREHQAQQEHLRAQQMGREQQPQTAPSTGNGQGQPA